MNRLLPVIVLLLALAGCMQVREAWLPAPEPVPVEEPEKPEQPVPDPEPEPEPEPTPEPEPEPDPTPEPEPDPDPTPDPKPEPDPDPEPGPEPDPDPKPEPEPDPEPVAVTIKLPNDVASLVQDDSGNGAITRVLLRYRALPSAELTAQSTPDWTEITVPTGDDAELELEPGDYEFEAEGHSGGGEVLAFGSGTLTVGDEPTGLGLEMSVVIGSVELVEPLALDSVAPGDEVTFSLSVRSLTGTYLLPASAYEVTYESSNSDILMEAPAEVTLAVHKGATGHVEVTADVTGLLQQPAGYGAGTLQSTATVLVREIVPDLQPPALEFEQLDAGGIIRGTVGDNDGLPALEVFEAGQLLGSIGGGQITITGPVDDVWQWEMDWQPQQGAHVLQAVASDASGNRTIRFQAWYESPPHVEPEDPTTYRSVSGAMDGSADSLPDLGYCAANELNTPGQGLQAVGAGLQAVGAGLQAVGAVGGLFLADSGSFGDSLISPAEVADAIRFTRPPADNGTSTILIVDDFGPEGVHELPAALLAGTASPEDLADMAAAGSITHGALVLHHIRSMLSSLGYSQAQAVPGVHETWLDSGTGFLLKLVNIHGLSTTGPDPDATIQGHIRAGLTTPPVAGARAVVNMSFVMVPCSMQEDLEASGIATFDEYLLALGAINGVEQEAAAGAANSIRFDDPLLDYFACPFFRMEQGMRNCAETDAVVADSLIHVASSGNFAMPFSMYPAAHPTVVSVSSGDHDGWRSAFSNAGGVMAPGSMYELVTAGGMTLGYAGTSFAAPVVSVFTAMDLIGFRYCYAGSMNPNGMSPPHLAQVQGNDVPLVYAYGNGGSAVDTYCAADEPR